MNEKLIFLSTNKKFKVNQIATKINLEGFSTDLEYSFTDEYSKELSSTYVPEFYSHSTT